jgi:hypothetical protein
VTIGIGFKCIDGIVICADTQITVPESHTYYAPKIWDDRDPDNRWSLVFTYAGSPDLMDSFKDKLVQFLRENKGERTYYNPGLKRCYGDGIEQDEIGI